MELKDTWDIQGSRIRVHAIFSFCSCDFQEVGFHFLNAVKVWDRLAVSGIKYRSIQECLWYLVIEAVKLKDSLNDEYKCDTNSTQVKSVYQGVLSRPLIVEG